MEILIQCFSKQEGVVCVSLYVGGKKNQIWTVFGLKKNSYGQFWVWQFINTKDQIVYSFTWEPDLYKLERPLFFGHKSFNFLLPFLILYIQFNVHR